MKKQMLNVEWNRGSHPVAKPSFNIEHSTFNIQHSLLTFVEVSNA
ncbi:MAG: hypothetical protein QOI58_3363 [Thermoanaerobaculia bacterium]|jgi:hypothetical protein|nr:hypothetical protein [Thermoanaerobaculia bacterium]